MPEFPEMEAARRALDEPVARTPVGEGRARARRDAEDVRPAARARSKAGASQARGGAASTCSSRPTTASSCSTST